MGRKEDNIQKATTLMNKLDHNRNIGIAAHIDHGNGKELLTGAMTLTLTLKDVDVPLRVFTWSLET